ncbi:unnamed protein product [Paramecium pentaurelia]|uniref:Uncharacterized protein n=1 Tax=Paramecium pentaurelia TaxID=43138 RepID=A0A8S1U5H5_9CILI|nr:unnamed protein product [Paramecium pentaurelia]
MQQQQRQENQHSNISFPNENQIILQKLIHLLQNKQRKPKPQFEQKNDEEENHFDTLLEYRENGSHLSQQQSTDTYQTYISINISDYEALVLKKILQDLLRDALLQQSDYEKKQQVHSDLQYQQYSSLIYDPQQSSNSDIVQSTEYEDLDDNKKTKNLKILNTKQLLNSFLNMKKRYEKYLQEIVSTKQTNNNRVRVSKLKSNIPKFLNQQKIMHQEKIILVQCRQMMEEYELIFQQFDQEIEELNQLYIK